MALHTMELVSVVLATVAFFTVATCQVQFDAVDYTIGESDGLIDIELCLDASNLTDSNVTATNTTALRVYITSEGETASEGIDFVGLNETLLLTKQCFLVNITILDDMVFEANETFIITASYNTSDGTTENTTSVKITILDDDNLELRVCNDSTITLTEGTDYSLCLQIELSRPIERDVSINISTSMGTASEGEDYRVVSTIASFNRSSVINSIVEVRRSIIIIDDDMGEPFEQFTVLVEAHDSTERVTIINGSINIIIKDNEIVVEGIVPANFSVTDVQSRSINFTWEAPDTDLTIIGYTVGCSGTLNQDDIMAPVTTASIGGLVPFTNYSCFVFTRVNGNRGNSTGAIIELTSEEAPGSEPRDISVVNQTSQHIELMWSPPELSYGIITNYTIRFDFNNGTGPNIATSNINQYFISSLQPYQNVSVMISATNSIGSGPFSNPTSFTTNESKSGPVLNLMAIGTDMKLSVTWSSPMRPNGVITGYNIVIYRVIINCSDNSMIEQSRQRQTDASKLVTLVAEVPYLVSVSAVNSVGMSDSVEVCAFTQQGRPNGISNVKALLTSNDTIMVQWRNLTLAEAKGWITHYTVHWWDTQTGVRASASNRNTSGVATSLEIKMGFDIFQTYNIVVTASTVAGQGVDSTIFVLVRRPRPPSSNAGVIAGTVILVLIIIAITVSIVLVLVLYRRRIFRGRSGTLSLKRLTPPNSIPLNNYHPYNNNFVRFDSPVEQVSKDIPIEEFFDHVKELHRESNHLFEHQYRLIKDANYRHDAAFLPCNRDTKNRFIDIFPYDANRVVLKKTSTEGSDYINASWINGYQRNNAYIAAQGPREETIEDFWRMISENQLSTIVMVTRLIEGPKMIEKCCQYWPSKVGHTLRLPQLNMMITLQESKLFADYTINTLTLKQPHCDDLEVTQFYYQGWPDHGVPQYATSVLGFLRHVRRKHPYHDPRPLLVHCSAGVGRTGTFITLDVMLQKIREEQTVNVHQFVKELRKHRCQMVQTESQYVFIHDALNEYILCGDTEIAVGNLRIALGKLYKQDSAGFKKQFQLLSGVSRRPTQVDLDAANSELHQHKNRYPERIPYKDTGVKLKPSGVVGGEYINATFINGYKCINSFVAAQTPLESTVETFWRMVWEIKCQTIVLLCDVERENSCVRFWPESGSATYGKLRVTATSKPAEKNDVINQKFEVCLDKQRTSTSNSEKLAVTLFHHTEWNEDGDQPSSKSILQLNNDVIRAQISTGNKPIIVACSDGCGRTGTFLSIYSQVERLKTEQVIDVFQWVKSSRIQRAWLVNNQEQYELIYEVLSDFIDSFDTYANFRVVEDDL